MQFVLWIAFLAFILLMLALDLGVFNREARVIGAREALRWTGFLFLLSLSFTVFVYLIYEHDWFDMGPNVVFKNGVRVVENLSGWEAAMQFLAGYLLEQALSMDNIFVIALIFAYFKIPQVFQHRVLFWGILGALILRGAMIGVGAELVKHFSWINYLFGAFLVVTAFIMILRGDSDPDPANNLLVRLARKFYPVTPNLDAEHFFTLIPDPKDPARTVKAMTPLFLALLVVESTDVLFAVDSIPAVFGVTSDPFIVFSSNVFAILGLRSMYFALASMIGMFRYLKPSLVVLLAFIGVKMIVVQATDAHVNPAISLGAIFAILAVGIGASIYVGPAPPEGIDMSILPNVDEAPAHAESQPEKTACDANQAVNEL